MKHGFETTLVCCKSVSVDSPRSRLSSVSASLGRPIQVITNAMNSRLADLAVDASPRMDGWIQQAKRVVLL